MEIRSDLVVDDEALADFAARHRIRRLAVFGSAIRADFGPHSDVDLLVEFEPGQAPGLLGIAEMEIELGGLLGREVDLRTAADLSPYFRDDVVAQARQLYAV